MNVPLVVVDAEVVLDGGVPAQAGLVGRIDARLGDDDLGRLVLFVHIVEQLSNALQKVFKGLTWAWGGVEGLGVGLCLPAQCPCSRCRSRPHSSDLASACLGVDVQPGRVGHLADGGAVGKLVALHVVGRPLAVPPGLALLLGNHFARVVVQEKGIRLVGQQVGLEGRGDGGQDGRRDALLQMKIRGGGRGEDRCAGCPAPPRDCLRGAASPFRPAPPTPRPRPPRLDALRPVPKVQGVGKDAQAVVDVPLGRVLVSSRLGVERHRPLGVQGGAQAAAGDEGLELFGDLRVGLRGM